jgi:hypothetical protein
MSIAGSILLENKDGNGNVIRDKDIQFYRFGEVEFNIKISTIPGSKNNARLCFTNWRNEEIPIPEGIRGEDVTDSDRIEMMIPMPNTQYFLIEHLRR